MNSKDKSKEALLKYSIISPLITTPELYSSNNAFFKIASEKEYYMDGGHKINVAPSTIQRWYYIYKKKGFNGLVKLKRRDCGKTRKVNEEMINEVEALIKNYPRMKAKDIYLQTNKGNKFSYDTINRIYKRIKNNGDGNVLHNQMLRYEMAHANDVWCADSSVGPYLYQGQEKKKLWIIAFIDDASRLVTGCKIFDSDNTINLMSTLKSAITVNGKPKVLNMDNGKNYRSRQMSIIAAKAGISLHYDPIKTPQSKAKIERFFKTLKEHWLASINYHDFKSIEDYQISLTNYISTYNNTIHKSLDGKTPIERRDIDAKLIKFIDKAKLDDDFLFEIDRKISFDCIALIDTKEFQTPAKFANKRVKIKYSFDYKKALIVDDDGKEYELKINNKIENSITKRSRLTEDK